jgi:hypothetical protein
LPPKTPFRPKNHSGSPEGSGLSGVAIGTLTLRSPYIAEISSPWLSIATINRLGLATKTISGSGRSL